METHRTKRFNTSPKPPMYKLQQTSSSELIERLFIKNTITGSLVNEKLPQMVKSHKSPLKTLFSNRIKREKSTVKPTHTSSANTTPKNNIRVTEGGELDSLIKKSLSAELRTKTQRKPPNLFLPKGLLTGKQQAIALKEWFTEVKAAFLDKALTEDYLQAQSAAKQTKTLAKIENTLRSGIKGLTGQLTTTCVE